MANFNSSHTGAEIDSAVSRVKDTAVIAGTVTASKGIVVDANKDISGFRNVTLTGQLQAATINLTGDTTIGDGDSDNITINADVNSNIIPNTDNTFDLGSASKQWKDLYVNGIGYIDQLGTDADPIAIFASSGEIDGTAIGSESASTGAFTTISASGNITGNLVGNVTGNLVGNVTGNVSGTAATVTGAAQSAITSVGTLTGLTVSGDVNFDSNTLFVDASENKVGIDNATPSSMNDSGNNLVIGSGASGDNTGLTIFSNSDSSGSIHFADGTSGDEAYRGIVAYTHSSDAMRFFTSGTEKMRINSSGNAGIGTTSPAVRGEIKNASSGAVATSGTTQTNGVLRLSSSQTTGVIDFGMNGSNPFIQATDSGGLNNFYNLVLNPAGGNVGIGTTSPQNDVSGLHVSVASSTDQLYLERTGSGTGRYYLGTSNNSFFIVDDAQSSTRFTINSSGNVGIGHTSAVDTDKLYVTDGASPYAGANRMMQIKRDATNGNDTSSFSSMLIGNNSNGFTIGYGGTTDRFRFLDGGGVERLTIVNGGDVGIGDTSPSTALTSFGSASKGLSIKNAQPTISFTDSDVTKRAHIAFEGGSRQLYLSSPESDGIITFQTGGFNERMRIASDGVIVSQQGIEFQGTALGSGQTGIASSGSGGDLRIYTNGTQSTTFKSSGQIETNYADNSYNLIVNGLASSSTKGILISVGPSSGTVDQMLFRDGNNHNCGAIFSDASANTTAYGTSSDYRLKENEVIIPDGLERLNRLKPYRFNFISAPDQIMDGFFAHELAEHIPEAVIGEKDAMEDGEIKPQNIDYGKITPLLVKALQEADDKIDALTARIEELENA